MTDQIQVIKQALEFCDYAWREIPMNDYAWEQLEETSLALRQALEQPAQKPVAWILYFTNEEGVPMCETFYSKDHMESHKSHNEAYRGLKCQVTPLYTAPPAQQLTEREIELIDGMIEMHLHHAAQCDNIANLVMAEKQKDWDMERVALLRKLKGGSDE